MTNIVRLNCGCFVGGSTSGRDPLVGWGVECPVAQTLFADLMVASREYGSMSPEREAITAKLNQHARDEGFQ